uniref:Uncharacterized protein n=1 Tax=Ixodes ricinus TaxID=34613 RepID=A0A0K8RI03_IXORI
MGQCLSLAWWDELLQPWVGHFDSWTIDELILQPISCQPVGESTHSEMIRAQAPPTYRHHRVFTETWPIRVVYPLLEPSIRRETKEGHIRIEASVPAPQSCAVSTITVTSAPRVIVCRLLLILFVNKPY